MTMRSILFVAVVGLLAPALSGCIGFGGDDIDPSSITDDAFTTTRGWSQPLEPALYDILPGVEMRLSSFDSTEISVGVFLPDIDGCDWEADTLPPECQLPVVMDSGPYYGPSVDQDKYRPPLIEWLVPRGYAVVQMSIRGTGESAGCMEFMSLNEQKDVDETITWLAEQAWSNGNVGMMGRSYDGTTPFMGAALGNPHLKTIVPISGVASIPDLMFKNGTSESRGPIMHSVVYWTFYGLGTTYGPAAADFRSDHWAEQACEETVWGQANGVEAFATGDTSADYWRVRHFQDRIVENYDGSVWIIHGMEDWNVNPSQVVPWVNELKDAGIDTRAWLGVWGHAYPDRVDEHRNVRWDWAQQTLDWFDFYLKDDGEQPPLDVEVEDSLFVWRSEERYPPADVQWKEIALSADMSLQPPGSASDGEFVLTGPPSGMAVSGSIGPSSSGPHAVFTSEPLDHAVRIAGLPQLHVTATPSTAGSDYVFAELHDVFPDGRTLRIGWAAINLRFADGGNTDPVELTPGEPVVAKMEFEPTDALVAQGHQLRLTIHKGGVEDIVATPHPGPTGITLGADSVLRLSTVDRPDIVPSYQPPGLG